MLNKIKQFIKWMDLVERSETLRGFQHKLNKKIGRLYDQMHQPFAPKDVITEPDYQNRTVPCTGYDEDYTLQHCPYFSEEEKCPYYCVYQIINNKYVETRQKYQENDRLYHEYLAKKRDAWKQFTHRKNK